MNRLHEAATLFQQLVQYTKKNNGYLPSANRKTHDNKLYDNINTYLRDLSRQYPERDGSAATNRSQSSNGGGKIPPRHDNYIPSSNRSTSYADDRYSARSNSANTHRSQSYNGGVNSSRYDNYRGPSSHSAYASGPDQGRLGKGNYNNYGNSSSFFRSSPQARLGAGGASASQPSNNGKRSRDDYNDYTHDHRNNKSYRR